MDFLLNPNVAYLLLVAASLLAVFAVITPGTGIFEVAALVALVLAGWQVYNLPINAWALAVLLLGVFPFLLAVRRTRRMVNLAISALALVVGSAFLFRGEVWWQPAVHPALVLVTSLSAGGLFWLMVTKVLDAESVVPAHDLSGLVGQIGEARTEIHEEGSAYVKGEMWTARSEEPIPVGALVRVIGREGLLLDVEMIEAPEEA